jgi:hypothetical protein
VPESPRGNRDFPGPAPRHFGSEKLDYTGSWAVARERLGDAISRAPTTKSIELWAGVVERVVRFGAAYSDCAGRARTFCGWGYWELWHDGGARYLVVNLYERLPEQWWLSRIYEATGAEITRIRLLRQKYTSRG